MANLIDIIIALLGISYVIIWSLSFYFQLFLILKVKHSEGYSIDFQIFNIFGFGFYTISNIHYMFQNGSNFDSIIDLIFSSHAFLISIVILGLTFYYPNKENKGHFGTYIMILILFVMTVIYFFLNNYWILGCPNDLWIFMGMGKSIVSTLKYLYQIYLNKERETTEGFSIENIILDLTGGSLSLLQVILEIVKETGRSFFDDRTNIPKIGLSVVVIFFDFVLIYQHYFVFHEDVIAKKKEKSDKEMIEEDLIQFKSTF